MSPIDPRALVDLGRDAGGRDGATAILRLYLDALPGRCDAVLEAVDETARGRAAHALLSPSALVGAARLAARCREIEHLSMIGRARSSEALAGLGRECDAVREALERLLLVPVTD